ncbi:MAG: PSD1 and planctomycete cytochrome C domain-containing protein [Pirellulales bacterium]|nr:PSD1 and planctomycete cytochrome C domain-containing protein [Pirellulales bacterium]
MRNVLGSFGIVWAIAWSGPTSTAADLPERVEFNRDVRPILSDNCYFCHGPDKNKRQADLRLDTRAGLFGESDVPGSVVAGDPNASELWRRMVSADPDEHMPPAESGKQPSEHELAIVRRWIEQGAEWEGHWSFTAIKRPAPPETAGAVAPIDAFIGEALHAAGLNPSPPAPAHVLVRRLALDLTGLPPSIDLVEGFAADPSGPAYERLVDQLLASPAFGERMAVWWLDLVRYADSVGYHGDQPVSVYAFREYIINAFNGNKRFDQFTIEQLAGDLLPEPTSEQRVASGYNRLGMMSAEGGVQDKEYLAKYIAERVRNLGGTWLGLTLGCAECHNHKFDPLATRDFYRFEAFFADLEERGLYSGANVNGEWGPRMQVPSPEQAQRQSELQAAIAATRAVLGTETPELAAAQAAWEAAQIAWTVLRPTSVVSAGGAELKVLDDGSILAAGKNPDRDTYTLSFAELPQGTTALRLETLPHDSLPQQGPGRAGNGNFVLSELTLAVQPASGDALGPITISRAEADHEQTSFAEANPYGRWAVAAAIDGDAKGPTWGWAILDQAGRDHRAVFELAADLALEPGNHLRLTLAQNLDNPGHNLGRFRVSAATASRPVSVAAALPEAIAAILAVPVDARQVEQRQALAAHFRTITPLLDGERAKLAEFERQLAELDKQIPTTLVARAVEPRLIRLLPRGNWMDDSGEIVEPGFPEFLSAGATAPAAPAGARLTRLDLAHWLVAPENPLVARVLANRLWKMFFGAGLSRKLDDLGAQGQWPTHPELLDYLAGQLIDSGWDLKRLVKQIVLSDTYRQSSVESPELRERDPDNRLWARQGRFRLEAEFVRDGALAASGLLVTQIGGPSVKPYQPPGYWAYLNFPPREWENDRGPALYRRGLYTHWQRQYLHPSLAAFDGPCREECTADRPLSNTPLQSLVLLNDPSYVEAARALAERMLHASADPLARLDWAFRTVVSRPIDPTEADVLLRLVEKHRQQYAADRAAADQLLAIGDHPAPADLDRAELAAWTSAARAVLNLHEAITRN